MLFFGHIAIAAALADATDSDIESAIAGNLLPDVVDKTGAWVLGVMPSGRWLAHGLPFLALACGAARAVLPRRRSRGFILGYTAHLLADHWAGGRLSWLAPFGAKPERSGSHNLEWLLRNLIPEAAGLAYLIWRTTRRTRTESP